MNSFTQILQASIAPVTLISGVGLLILSLTNRYGRAIDRVRALLKEGHNKEAQIELLLRRAHLLKKSIACSGVCILCTGLLMLTLFLALITHRGYQWVAGSMLFGALISLSASIIFFLKDVSLSLGALELEVSESRAEKTR